MGWIRLAGKGLEWAGQLAQADGFEEWAWDKCRGTVEDRMSKYGRLTFRKKRRAIASLWGDFQSAIIASNTLSAAVGAAVGQHAETIGQLFEVVSARKGRVHALPRFLVNRTASHKLETSFGGSRELDKVASSQMLKDYFFAELLRQMDETVSAVSCSARKPFDTTAGWCVVHCDLGFDWYTPPWSGHFLGWQAKKVPRKERDLVESQSQALLASFASLRAEEIQRLAEQASRSVTREGSWAGLFPSELVAKGQR